MNLQPWAFAVVLDRERIGALGQRAKEWLLAHQSDLGLGEMALGILARPNFTIFYNAPALVIVVATSAGAQASEDCCLAAQNLLLAARDKEIGSCWIGFARPWLDLAATKRELGISQSYHVVAPIILGYPATWPEPHGRKEPEIQWV
jgi:nitroreductase